MDLLPHFFRPKTDSAGKAREEIEKPAPIAEGPLPQPASIPAAGAATPRWRLERDQPAGAVRFSTQTGTPAGEVTLILDDVLPRVPTHALKPGLHDPDLPLRFPVGELRDGLARGRPTVRLSRLAAEYPEIFEKPESDAEDTEVMLPMPKILQQMGAARAIVETTALPPRRVPFADPFRPAPERAVMRRPLREPPAPLPPPPPVVSSLTSAWAPAPAPEVLAEAPQPESAVPPVSPEATEQPAEPQPPVEVIPAPVAIPPPSFAGSQPQSIAAEPLPPPPESLSAPEPAPGAPPPLRMPEALREPPPTPPTVAPPFRIFAGPPTIRPPHINGPAGPAPIVQASSVPPPAAVIPTPAFVQPPIAETPPPVPVPEPVAPPAEPETRREPEPEPQLEPEPEPSTITPVRVPEKSVPLEKPPELFILDQEPLQAIFMTDEELDLPRISELSAGLPGITGCMILAGDHLTQGGERPTGLDAVTLRELSRKLSGTLDEFKDKLPAESAFTLYGGNRALSIFSRTGLCLCVVHAPRGFLPGVRERLSAVADSLARGVYAPGQEPATAAV